MTLAAELALVTMGCQDPDWSAGRPPEGKLRRQSRVVQMRQVQQTDLLFVVDNSASMADKHSLLRDSVVETVRRVIAPPCFDRSGGRVPSEGDGCPNGANHAVERLRDLRVGIITTSLGGHGSPSCPDDEEGKNDRAHLLPTIRSAAPDPEGSGFLWWRDGSTAEQEDFLDALSAQFDAIGGAGCEFEAPLESMYRFLVDPSPPLSVVVQEDGLSRAATDGDGKVLVDEELLDQRERFLRPQSLLAVFLISDENDCSVMDGGRVYRGAGRGHLLMDPNARMPRATEQCSINPNHACCLPCSDPRASECGQTGCESQTLDGQPDPFELRCFDQMRRFGRNFLFPIERYVDALTKHQLVDHRTGESFENPIFLGAGRRKGTRRDPYLVKFVSVTGVPFGNVMEEISGPESNRLLDPSDLELPIIELDRDRRSRWDLMLGRPDKPINGAVACGEDDPECGAYPFAPEDPFLIEDTAPRAPQTSPLSGDTIVGPDSLDPQASPTNGHESLPFTPSSPKVRSLERGILQPACQFPLASSRTCEASDPSCPCGDEPSRNRAVCQPPTGGEATNTQYFSSASPGTRLLRVTRELGWQGQPVSICPPYSLPNSPLPSDAIGFGYNSLVQPLREFLPGTSYHEPLCLGPYDTTDDGLVDCTLLEGTLPAPGLLESEVGSSDCSDAGRFDPEPGQRAAFVAKLSEWGLCADEREIASNETAPPPCDEYRICVLPQLEGDDQARCRSSARSSDSHPYPGFCYVDARTVSNAGVPVSIPDEDQGIEIVDTCPPGHEHGLHLVGKDVPSPNSILLITCQSLEWGERSSPSAATDFPPSPDPVP